MNQLAADALARVQHHLVAQRAEFAQHVNRDANTVGNPVAPHVAERDRVRRRADGRHELALLDRELTRFVTGRFTMVTRYSSKQDQYLEINIELKEGARVTQIFRKLTLQKIINKLRTYNAEFKELHKYLGNRALPKLIFYPKDHIKYFKPGVKQIWTEKHR